MLAKQPPARRASSSRSSAAPTSFRSAFSGRSTWSDTLLREDSFISVKSADTFRLEVQERLEALRERGEEGLDALLEDQLGALRRYKNEEVLLASRCTTSRVRCRSRESRSSSPSWPRSRLQRCLALAEAEAQENGRLPRERLCVIAMGKLGGRELGYHSDLDSIFLLFRHPEGDLHGEHARLAQRLMSFLQMPLREGYLYKIDTRLRPSGNQGALVTTAGGFARYHTGGGGGAPVRSQLWERQALLRARFVAGDAALFEEVREAVLVPSAIWTRPTDRAQARGRDPADARADRGRDWQGGGPRPESEVGAGGPHRHRVRSPVPSARPRPRPPVHPQGLDEPGAEAPARGGAPARYRTSRRWSGGTNSCAGSTCGCASSTTTPSTTCRKAGGCCSSPAGSATTATTPGPASWRASTSA